MGRDLTIEELKDIESVLLPIIRDALRPQFHEVRDAMQQAIVTVDTDMREKLATLEARIAAVEKTNQRGLIAWGWIVAGATVLFHVLRDQLGAAWRWLTK